MTIIFLGIGLAAGLLSGMFGIGGGIIIVPLLTLLAKMPPKLAQGTSLTVFLLPVGALGAWTYYKSGDVNIRASLLVALGLLVGALFGALIAQAAPPLLLRRGFAILLVVTAGKLWIG